MADVEVPQFDPTAKKRQKKNYRSKTRLLFSLFPFFFECSHKTKQNKTVTEEEQKLLSQFGDKKRPKKVAGADAASTTAAASSEGGRVAGYTYEELLTRIFGILAEKNPEHGTRSQPIYIKPPTVGREGKKTVWFNFGEICDQFVDFFSLQINAQFCFFTNTCCTHRLNRTTDHFSQFVFAELGTTGSLDANRCLVIRGRYLAKHIEVLIRHYIKEYVACASCKSFKTTLSKDNRLYFLTCNECHSKRTVQPIKRGYQAQIGKRKKTEDH